MLLNKETETEIYIYHLEIDWLIAFNDMPTCLRLFYT